MKLKLAKTKLADDYGRPIAFYHTTNVAGEIQSFYPLSHFGTKKAAELRGIHFAYQFLGLKEPSVLPETLPEKLKQTLFQKSQDYLKTYQVHLFMKSPLKIKDFGKHGKDNYRQWFLGAYSPKSIYLTPKECLERDNSGIINFPYKKALTDFIFDQPALTSESALEKELNAESLFSPPFKNKQELAEKVSLQRMIRYLESEGYDGFVYENDFEDKGKKSYIIFRAQQVFKPSETEHEVPNFSTEQQNLLNKIESDFFEKRGFLPPFQRKELNRQIRNKKLFNRVK